MDRIWRQYMEVASCKNISHAAKKLCISQPTLTHNMKKLEAELDIVLFNRSSKGITLTESGELLLEQTRIMQRLYDNTLSKLAHVNKRQERELKVGTGHAWWHLFLREAVKDYRQKHPGANITIDVGNHLPQMDLLLSGDIDLFIGHEITGLSRKAEVKFLPLRMTENSVFVRKGHPLTYKESCTLQDLVEFPTLEVKPSEDRYQHLIEDPQEIKLYRSIHQLTEKIIYSSNSLSVSMDLVKDSNALLPFPEVMADYFADFGLVPLPLNETYSKASFGIYLLRESSEDNHICELVALINHYIDGKFGYLKAAN
ncbi:LysR family transcriptional regulator [Vibrio paracholerae]|uniref:LysR substrate-binding domain-containing protein n=1 Tax=Vibrio paracholerae TaxID=650003 RepID=UPI002084466E|nr:LysR family transcriptional regulator [Vibrio paracholerae]MCO7025121.1 LysR family transcriptional regulator [Vibrio paracholerae]GHW31465.1 transcriptional regulator, LysR family [Vibrio cholerae]GHY45602.1 transcriptional regulator, LysR family [Vibrio cholerae]GHZ42535.1 transcriptional regulator, LysR family [Vibrio cholerae]